LECFSSKEEFEKTEIILKGQSAESLMLALHPWALYELLT